MTIYLENLKKPTKKKKSHKIDEFSKNSGYKVNTQKNNCISRSCHDQVEILVFLNADHLQQDQKLEIIRYRSNKIFVGSTC